MIRNQATTSNHSASKRGSGTRWSTPFSALRGIKAVPPLALLVFLAIACEARDLEESTVLQDENVGGGDGGGGAPVLPPRLLPCGGGECAGITCPLGFSRVGAADARGSFCIAQQQEPAATYLQAITECFTMSTSTGAEPHLCTMQEWYLACSQGADDGEPSIDDMTNDWETVSDPINQTTAMAIGKGSCSTKGAGKMTKLFAFRCCVR